VEALGTSHGCRDFVTAISHSIPVVWLILQNDSLAMVRDMCQPERDLKRVCSREA
jgi:hypothetical protein